MDIADRLTLKQLRALAAAMEHGSIAAAAEDLHVTGPAVSLQLKLLSETVGLPLYERRRNGLIPTPAGREAMVAATRIAATLQAFEQAINFLSKGDEGRVSIGAVSTAKYFAPRIIAAFNKAHPTIDVSLLIGNREAIIDALERNKIDFAIMGHPPGGSEYEKVVIGEHPQIFIAPPNHPLADRSHIDLQEIAGERFLLRERGSGTRTIFSDLLAKAGLDVETGIEFGSNETIKQSVMAGIGVALLSAHTVTAEILDGRLKTLNVIGAPVIRHWFVVKQQEKTFMPATTRLWRFVAMQGEEILEQL